MKLRALFLAPVMIMALAGCNKTKTDQQIVDEMVKLPTNVNNPVNGANVQPDSHLKLQNGKYLLGVKKLSYETGKKDVVAEPEIQWTFSNENWKLQDYEPSENYYILKPKLVYKEADVYDTDLTLTMTWNGKTASSVYHVSIYY